MQMLRATYICGPTMSPRNFSVLPPVRLSPLRSICHKPIKTLLNANQEWAQSVVKDTPDFFARSATSQNPKVCQSLCFQSRFQSLFQILWIGCSDSRVPESVITASKPGDIFVHRNVANQFHLHDDSALSVLTFAIKEVGVEHVILVGHTNCGGAMACIEAAKVAAANHGVSTPLTRWLSPLTALVQSLDLSAYSASEALRKVVEANIIKQVDNICKSEPITTAWADPNAKKVAVHGWMYDLAKGRIEELVVRDS
ncbi:carbonic anhydrase [Suillus bovinus]|uniref:carbonic anhydrase n=1 Tax=Suillus bovinus TaxID=48563 RepID=UPI001B87CBAC|nr:carbonic anhydrase [Suillus bovinus]KAG2143501.1 carbonic anhydrase [Suillus bovinus]